MRPPKLTLVGAGPGDPGLITIKGVEALRMADVVLYDALANPTLLDHAPPHARKIFVGKRKEFLAGSFDVLEKPVQVLERNGEEVIATRAEAEHDELEQAPVF